MTEAALFALAILLTILCAAMWLAVAAVLLILLALAAFGVWVAPRIWLEREGRTDGD